MDEITWKLLEVTFLIIGLSEKLLSIGNMNFMELAQNVTEMRPNQKTHTT